MPTRWQAWQTLPPLPNGRTLAAPVLAELLDGGQSFRWRRVETDAGEAWEGGWAEHHARVRATARGTLEFATPDDARGAAGRLATAEALHAYLAGPPAEPDALPWRSDPHLAACMTAFPGLGILRQPFGEALLGFVCSATKQIVQIKQMLALIAARHGRSITGQAAAKDEADAPGSPEAWRRLPTWEELAGVSEESLRACALGFRARHMAGIAAFLAANPGWLEATERAPYPEAKARLLTLPGVGEKVADCVLLFGAGRLEAFPVDTWIIKAMARRYGLDGWRPAQVAQFGRVHFGAQAGLAQQFLFAFERAQGRR